MPSGGDRIGGGRPKKNGAPAAAPDASAKDAAGVSAGIDAGLTPLDFMLQVLRDPKADPILRARMAIAAAPFLHPKIGDDTKKRQKREAADRAVTGKFAPAAPPKSLGH